MPRHTESDCQKALIRWWSLAHRGLGVPHAHLLFAIPNGGPRDQRTGARLKAEGARAGVPDLFLAVPKAAWSGTDLSYSARWNAGLFIELKTWTGRIQESQSEMLSVLRAQGYAAVIARGFDQAQRAITQYLQGREITL